MFRDEFDPGGVVERMKIIIIDFFFFSLSSTFAVWKEKTGQESARVRERERERRKEGKRKLPLMRIPLHFPDRYLPTWYLRLQWLLYFTLLRFTLLSMSCRMQQRTQVHMYISGTCTCLYLLLSTVVCIVYICRYGRYNCVDRIESNRGRSIEWNVRTCVGSMN